jgi:hypothetical protein
MSILDGSTVLKGIRGPDDDKFNRHRRAVLGPVTRRSVSPSPLRYQGNKSVNTSENPRGRPSSTPPARLSRQSSKSSFHSFFDHTGTGVDDHDPFLIRPKSDIEFHSLPIMSTIRRQIAMLKDEEDSRQLRARVSFLLVKARGEVGDWRGTSSERLRMLPGLLSRANMASELTRSMRPHSPPNYSRFSYSESPNLSTS